MADDLEIWFERGVTDGLPVVPPTRERVERMLGATRRKPDELIGLVAPNYGRATVEKIAVNAVMAGCRLEYFPMVLAVVEAVCDPAFNLHGQSGTTNAASPLIILNGPARLMINLGGARPGEIAMSTMGHPGRYTYCIGEHEEASPWEPLHVERGFAAAASAVTLFSGEAPFMVNDHLSRGAPQLLASLGWSAAGVWNHKAFPLYGHTLWVIGPEHAKTLGDEGWSKRDVRQFLYDTIRRPARDLAPGPDGGESGRLKNLLAGAEPDDLIPKFPSPDEIVIVVAGGTAGRFSAVVPGWMGGAMGSRPVTRVIEENRDDPGM
ncbi:MAG: hypothetical protein AUH29_03150 [Candidatus Rokubacteria bacterium 13_1_40CM_69_27]|nr:MAG: hypothetical protein AUH29_03150 [Candidatus Rokubacteria bacterium 13_1_40CM_69_27]